MIECISGEGGGGCYNGSTVPFPHWENTFYFLRIYFSPYAYMCCRGGLIMHFVVHWTTKKLGVDQYLVLVISVRYSRIAV